MLYAFNLNSKFLKNKQTAAIFLANSLISTGAAYLYEKKYKEYLFN
jgi:hypothetical protein